jgi:hypothetical protein
MRRMEELLIESFPPDRRITWDSGALRILFFDLLHVTHDTAGTAGLAAGVR